MHEHEHPPDEAADDAALNPALRRSEDPSYGPSYQGTDPMKTLSVQDTEEGSSWPWIWAAVAILGVVVTLYLVIS